MSTVDMFNRFSLPVFCFHPSRIFYRITYLFPSTSFPLLCQLLSRTPSTCSIVISLVDKGSLFSTQTRNFFTKTAWIFSLFQSTLLLKFPLLTVFMWFLSYRNDSCRVSGERRCAAAPFSACVTRTSQSGTGFPSCGSPILFPLPALNSQRGDFFFPFLTVGLKGSRCYSYLWLGFHSLFLSSYNAALPPVQTSKVASSLKS